jgi:hypothetical protein
MATIVTVKNAVKNEISSTSTRTTGPSCETRNTSLEIEKYRAARYTDALKTVGKILLVTAIATPFTLMIDALVRESIVAIDQMTVAAIKLVAIGISHCVVMSFTGSPFGFKLWNLNRKPLGFPTNLSTHRH